MNPQSKAFMAHIIAKFPKAPREVTRYGGSPPKKYYAITADLLAMTPKDFKALISDSSWNSYPLDSWTPYNITQSNPDHINERDFYRLIELGVKNVLFLRSDYRKTLIEHSTGVFRVATIDHTLGKDKLRAAKIGLLCQDQRVRLRAAYLSPIKDITNHLPTETNKAVREKIIKRIGYLNCLDEAIKPENHRWYRRDPLKNSPFLKTDLDNYVADSRLKGSVEETAILTKMVYNLSKEDALFYINLIKATSNVSPHLGSLLGAKISGEFEK